MHTLATQLTVHLACEEGHLETVKVLLEKSIEYSITLTKDDNGRTAFYYAFFNGYIEIAKFLLKKYPSLVESSNISEMKAARTLIESRNMPGMSTFKCPMCKAYISFANFTNLKFHIKDHLKEMEQEFTYQSNVE